MKLMEKQLEQAENAKPLKIPKPPKILPMAPPVATFSADAAEADQEARRKAGNRMNTARGTLFAGETGGYKGTLGGPKTLLS